MQQDKRGWSSLFSLLLFLRGWGPGLSHNIQFPSLRPRSSMSCQTQISHSAAHNMSKSPAQSWKKWGTRFCLGPHSGHAVRDKWGALFCSATVSCWTVPDKQSTLKHLLLWATSPLLRESMVLPSHQHLKDALLATKEWHQLALFLYMILKITNIPFYVLLKSGPWVCKCASPFNVN